MVKFYLFLHEKQQLKTIHIINSGKKYTADYRFLFQRTFEMVINIRLIVIHWTDIALERGIIFNLALHLYELV